MTAHVLKAALKAQAGEAEQIKGTERPAVAVKLPTPADVTGALSLQVSVNNMRATAKSARERGELTVARCQEIEADEMERSVVNVLIPDEPLGVPGLGASLFPRTKRWKPPRPSMTR